MAVPGGARGAPPILEGYTELSRFGIPPRNLIDFVYKKRRRSFDVWMTCVIRNLICWWMHVGACPFWFRGFYKDITIGIPFCFLLLTHLYYTKMPSLSTNDAALWRFQGAHEARPLFWKAKPIFFNFRPQTADLACLYVGPYMPSDLAPPPPNWRPLQTAPLSQNPGSATDMIVGRIYVRQGIDFRLW